ncbi:AAA family ATPase [Paucibacter sp. JuS9]|uniref:AAA family ATPase n=1 Tax=Paucibacter sp. JuS9 TaxID=3228748 RepID=UPI003757D3ED
MLTLVFANQKGGVGKTTLAGHVAVAATSAGEMVVLMDTDPQGSLSDWWNVRVAEDISFATARLGDLSSQLHELGSQGYTLAIIDTPPAVTATIATVVAAADLVVIPTRPSPHDLRAVGRTVALCTGRPMFLINGAAARARLTAQAAIALSEHGAVAPIIVHQRTDFAAAMVDGRTAQELDARSKCASEMDQLWTHIKNRLKSDKQ